MERRGMDKAKEKRMKKERRRKRVCKQGQPPK
jgi:hypothetical protein